MINRPLILSYQGRSHVTPFYLTTPSSISTLKTVSSNVFVPAEISSRHSELLEAILHHIEEASSLTLASLQLLGYILFNEHLVR